MKPIVCLCGRPNVGKSSLFNRLIGRRQALVLDQPGVTRDVNSIALDLDGFEIELADLAGLDSWQATKRDPLKKLSAEAALRFLEKSSLILFVVDGREGLGPEDEELARLVRKLGKPVQVILSKIEGSTGSLERQAQVEAAALGWGEGLPTSAEHNIGIQALKERIVEILRPHAEPAAETPAAALSEDSDAEVSESENIATKPIRLGVYGRPNVGKSTLANAFLGENRLITSPIAGTTVDKNSVPFTRAGRDYIIVDTAGIRRKSKTNAGVEVLSVVQALKSVAEVDVALLLIDGYEGVTDQDEKIAGELLKTGKPILLLINKWDQCRGSREKYAERVRGAIPFLDFAPVLFVSAAFQDGLDDIWDLIDEVLAQRKKLAPTAELNRFFEVVEGSNNPLEAKIYYASQTSRNPPTITCVVNDIKKVHFSYERFLRNELRNRYGWMGSPIRMVFKTRPSKRASGAKIKVRR